MDYLHQFSEFNNYEHKVLAEIEGKRVPVPFNLNSLDIIYPESQAKHLTDLLISTYGMDVKIPILKLRETSNKELKDLAEFIYQNVSMVIHSSNGDLVLKNLIFRYLPAFLSLSAAMTDTSRILIKGYPSMVILNYSIG